MKKTEERMIKIFIHRKVFAFCVFIIILFSEFFISKFQNSVGEGEGDFEV